MHLLIVAKRPLPGRAKTRLIPTFGPDGAASLAAAALADTFEAAGSCRADRVVVAFDGDPAGVVPAGFEVVPQRPGNLADRLGGAWTDAGGPGLQIGMDTPQLTGADLDAAYDLLDAPGTEAVLGPAVDGGWWAIGMHAPADVFAGIATSRADTGAQQLGRLRSLGLSTHLLPTRRDVDRPNDAFAVAALAPWSRFAATLGDLVDRGIYYGADRAFLIEAGDPDHPHQTTRVAHRHVSARPVRAAAGSEPVRDGADSDSGGRAGAGHEASATAMTEASR